MRVILLFFPSSSRTGRRRSFYHSLLAAACTRFSRIFPAAFPLVVTLYPHPCPYATPTWNQKKKKQYRVLSSRVMKVHHAEAFGSSAGRYGGGGGVVIAAEMTAAVQQMSVTCRARENGTGGSPCCGRSAVDVDRCRGGENAAAAADRDATDDERDEYYATDGCRNCTAVQRRRRQQRKEEEEHSRRPRHRSGSWP